MLPYPFVRGRSFAQRHVVIVVVVVVDVGGGVVVVAVGRVYYGLVLFGVPDAAEELVHVHGPEVLAALAQCVLELVQCQRVYR